MSYSGIFDEERYLREQKKFPKISFDEFKKIKCIETRKEIAKKNKILRTDSYNRVMDFTKGERGNKKEVFYLSFRKELGEKFNVIYGVKNTLDDICRSEITQSELDFAIDFYKYQTKKGGNGKFNIERWQRIIDDNNGMIPLKIVGVDDGTILRAGEPILRVEGEAEIAAIFEPLFIRTFYQSIVATNSRFIEEIIGEGRMVEFGYRSAINDKMHMDAFEALMVGGGISRTSSDISAAALDIATEGTTAHRFFTAYPTEDDAMEEAIMKNDRIALLVDSVEAYAGIDKIIELKKKYRHTGKIISPRLDSGDLIFQSVYSLQELDKAGMIDPKMDKIIIEDFDGVDEIFKIELAVREAGYDPKDYIMYGSGSLLMAKDKTRDVLGSVYKLCQTEDGYTMKLSKNKNSIPGIPNVEIIGEKRLIVQEDEKILGKRLLKPLYDNGTFFFERTTLEDIDIARKMLLSTRKNANLHSVLSRKTQEMVREFRERKDREGGSKKMD